MKENITKDNICSFIDHTDVKPDASEKDIEVLCLEAKKYNFHSVCVTPTRVKDARKFLGKSSKIEIICVVGFPFGVQTSDEKVFEAISAKKDGATEFDMIINIGKIKDKNWNYVKKEIESIANAIKPNGLKVIMEIGFLTKKELIKSCETAISAGAKFVKTSTGYGPRVPTTKDIKIMKKTVGPKFGVKASGGIHDFAVALNMINAGADRIGTSSGLQIIGIKKPTLKKEKE